MRKFGERLRQCKRATAGSHGQVGNFREESDRGRCRGGHDVTLHGDINDTSCYREATLLQLHAFNTISVAAIKLTISDA